jgi:hypothetical protein
MLQLLGFIIDCPDPMKLAAFYSEMTGCAIMEGSSDNFAGITFGEVDLAFQRVEHYRPPRWPDDEHPKQYHLDFEVGEIEPEQRRVVDLGATLQKGDVALTLIPTDYEETAHVHLRRAPRYPRCQAAQRPHPARDKRFRSKAAP